MKEKNPETLQMLVEVVDSTWVHSVCFTQQGHMGSLSAGLVGSGNHMLHQGSHPPHADTDPSQAVKLYESHITATNP